MVKTEDVRFQYIKGQEMLHFPNIDLNANENLLILGKSGIGKTTFLHLLAGLLKPNNGQISIIGTKINELSTNSLDTFRGEHIGIVFQKKHAIQSLSIYENLKARLFFSNKKLDENSIETILSDLGLFTFKNRKPKELSEGQLQRLGIAMSVIHQPKVIFADEPTSSLDDENCRLVIQLLLKQAEKHQANLIVITHDQRIKPYFPNTITL
ncbi:MAG: ABC transporter ATP-binding protein [bacterium]